MPIYRRIVLNRKQIRTSSAKKARKYVDDQVIPHASLIKNAIIRRGLDLTTFVIGIRNVFVHWVPHFFFREIATSVTTVDLVSAVIFEVYPSGIHRSSDGIDPINTFGALEHDILPVVDRVRGGIGNLINGSTSLTVGCLNVGKVSSGRRIRTRVDAEGGIFGGETDTTPEPGLSGRRLNAAFF